MALGVGVIGTGGMGGRHLENLDARAGQASVVAVMDTDAARLAKVADTFQAVPHRETQALIDDPNVEAILIASPDSTHAELALACIAAGKPVLCEKPLATTVEDARAVVEAEAATGRSLVQVGFMRHFDPQHVAVKAAIDRGDIGRRLYFRGWHRSPALPPYPSSAEVIVSSAIHDLYSARWLLDSEISEISVIGTATDPARSSELELQVITMKMANGTIGMVEVNRDSSYGYEVGWRSWDRPAL